MSLSSRSARKALVVAGLGATAALGAAGTAGAAQIQLKYLCNYPLIGIEALDANVTASIPDEWPIDRPTGRWSITAEATTSANTWTGLNTLKGKRLETVENLPAEPGFPNSAFGIEAAAKVNLPGTPPSVTNVFPLLEIAPYTVPARKAPLVLTATGTTPTITLQRAGLGNITIGNLALNLRLYDSAGVPINVDKTLEDQNLDEDDTTFEVYCRPATSADEILDDDDNPTGEFYEDQSVVLTDINLVNAPNKPGKPAVTVDGTSATVKWGSSTLPRNPAPRSVAKYEFYNGTTKIGEAPGHAASLAAGTEQTTTLTGLPAGNYDLTVVAVENNGTTKSNPSLATPFTIAGAPVNTPPSAPGAATATAIGETGATLNWGAATDADGTVDKYEITGIGAAKETTGSVRTLPLTGLTPNTTYTASIVAVDDDGAKGPATTVTFKTLAVNVKPTAPTGLSSSSVTATSATVSWTAGTDSDGTVVGYEVTGAGAAQTVTGTSINLTGLSPLTPYTVTVKSKDDDGALSDAATVTFTTPAGADTTKPTVPGKPSLLGGQAGVKCDSIAITWAASTDNVAVTKYIVNYDDFNIEVPGNQNSITLTQGINEDAQYFIRVRAVDAAGNMSANSADLEVLTPIQCEGPNDPPSAPGDVTVTDFTATTATLAFGPATDDKGVVGYDVFEGPALTDPWIGGGTTSPVVVTELTTGKPYTLYVRARDAAGLRGPAKSVQVTPRDRDTVAPSQPGAVTTSELKFDSVKLNWGASTDNVGVTGYVLTYGSQTINVAGNVLTSTLTGLSEKTAYTVTVKAKDAEGNLSAGREVTFTTPAKPDTVAPSKPGTVVSSEITNTSVKLTWGASTDNVGVTGYEVFNGTTKVADATGTSVTVTGLSPNQRYTLTVKAKDAANNVSEGTSVTFDSPDTIAPTKPGTATSSNVKFDSASIAWGASTDARGVTGYVLTYGTQTVNVPGNTLSAALTGLAELTDYTVSIKAKDAAGNLSEAQTVTFKTTERPDTTAPTKPTLTLGAITDTTVALSWAGATDNKGVTGYDVFQGTTKVASVTGTSTTVTALRPATSYTFTVKAKDAAGNVSDASNAVTAKTTGGGIFDHAYDLTGSSVIKTLSKGSVPLKGSVDSTWDSATGAFSATLQLNPTRARLTSLGFIPLTADVQFVQASQTVGTLIDGELKSNSKMRIRLPKIYLFGSIPLAGGTTCQTKRLADINLASDANGFEAGVGGTLTGVYSLSDLSGCGFLNGLVSPLTAGNGNTISVKLTGKS